MIEWMGGRVVEGTGLENRQAGDRLVGSNPTPSATLRPAGFGWQAAEGWTDDRNRTLGVGVSPEALA